MAKSLQINIQADGKDFINTLNQANDASYKSEKTISQLSNQIKNLSVFQEKGSAVNHVFTTSVVDLVTKLDKSSIVYRELHGDIEGLVKAQKELQKVLQTQLQYGADEKIQKFLLDKNRALLEEIDSKKKAAKAEEELRKEKEETLALWLKEKQAHEELVAHNAKVAMQNQELARKRREQAAAAQEEAEIVRMTTEALAEEAKQKELLADWVKAKKAREEEIAYNEKIALQNQELARKRREQAAAAKEEAEIARLTAEAVAEEARQKEELATNVMVALGDKVGLLQVKYRQLEAELKESIKTTGVSSDRTRALANEMNNLSVQIKQANYTPFNVRIKNLLSSFVSAQAILWGVRSAFRLVTNTISDSMKAASAAEETWNLFVTTFNDVEATAINASNAIASSMGLATSTAQKALGVFGDLALGYGQTDAAALEFAETLTKASLDLISYKNLTGSYDEIFSSIASGIAGNVENFRKYGVVITQAEVKTRLQQKGLDKLTGSSLQFAQMQERMNIFIEKTANAQGDMIKTMESTENVTRRLSEATKEWKENFGEDWNKTLTPVKSAIADYIESINRAREAEKQWAEGRTDISVYSDLNSEERRIALLNAMLKDVDIYSEANTLNALKKIMVMFNSSADEMISLYDNLNLGDNIGYLREPLERHENYYKTKNDRASSLEKEKKAVQEVKNAYKNLTDTLNQIEGISIGALSSDNLVSSIANLVGNISNTDSSSYSSPIDIALGLNSIEDDFKAKMEAIKKLYEETYNFFLSQDGILDNQEKSTLKSIASLYTTVNGQLDEHNAKIEAEKERLKAVESVIESIANTAESYKSKIAEDALSSSIKTQFSGSSDAFINNEIARASALASNKAMYDEQKVNAVGYELVTLRESFKLAESAINEYYDAVKKNIEEEELIQKQKEAANKWDAMDSAYQTALAWNQTPMTPTFSSNAVAQEAGAELYSELMSAIDQMVSEMEAAGIEQAKIDAAVNEISGSGLEYIRQIVENTEKEQKDAWKGESKDILMGGLGEVGDIFNALSSASGLGGLVTIFADLAVQTEAFQRVASLLSDNVLPVLNAFLEPLLPLIDMFGDHLQMVAETVLEPLFPLMKMIAKVGVYAMGISNIVMGFIADGIKIITGTIVAGITDLINGVIDVINNIPFVNIGKIDNQWAKDWRDTDIFGNVADKWEDMNDHLASIDKMSMEIADNTDPSKSEALKIYEDLYKSGTLSATQYSGYLADLAGNRYDKVGVLASGLSYQKKNGGTYVAKQNVSIQIDGSNLSEEQLVSAIQKALDTSTSPGGNTYAYGVA